MATVKGAAPAKVNLTLHVTGQRTDGYHQLDSLVVFADVADQITATQAPQMRLHVSGPFAQGVPADDTNLVMRAANLLRRLRGVVAGADITLDKQLPHAAGIGSGSSDAATTLDVLARLWGVAPLSPQEALPLGADVPVCMHAPAPVRMAGIGDILSPAPALPPCAMVLVNPGVSVATSSVFDGLANKRNPAMGHLPQGVDFKGFCDWLGQQRNDLQLPAAATAPDIDVAIAALNTAAPTGWAGMSGSGATCIGLVRDMAAARQVARAIQIAHLGWWVRAAAVL